MHTDPKCQPRLLTRARQLALPVDPAASRSINYEPRWPGSRPGPFWRAPVKWHRRALSTDNPGHDSKAKAILTSQRTPANVMRLAETIGSMPLCCRLARGDHDLGTESCNKRTERDLSNWRPAQQLASTPSRSGVLTPN